MRKWAIVLVMALAAALQAAGRCLVDQSGCLGSPRGGSQDYGEVIFEPRGNDLLIYHLEYTWYCCLEASAAVTIKPGEIVLKEVNRNGICRCICTYDLKYFIPGIPDGTYVVHVITHDGTEIATEKITFPSGEAGLKLLRVTDCLSSEGKESVKLSVEDTTLRITHENLRNQCCAEFTVRYTIRGDRIEVYEYDEARALCFCMCNFNIETEIPDLPPGTYTVTVYGPDGKVRSEEEIKVGSSDLIPFVRGEVNGDGKVDLADAISILTYLFGGGPAPRCADSADANDDGAVDISDAIFLLGYLFGGQDSLPAPFPNAGFDPTADSLKECTG